MMPSTTASILDNLDIVAVIGAGIFAGTALYVSIGEVPALREFGLDEHWRFFPYMYKNAAALQAPAAAISGLAGIVHGTRIIGSSFHRNLWIGSGIMFLAMGPFTMLCIAPTNKFIINANKNHSLGEANEISVTKKKELLDKWVGLHLVRTVASMASFTAMVFGLSHHSSLVLGW